MAVGDVYQLAIDQEMFGVHITNVYHYEQTTGGSGNDEIDLIEAWKEDILPTWKALVTNQLTFTCLRARQVSGVGTFPEVLQILVAETGDKLTEALPANSVAVISWYSQQYDKSGRGRSFISGLSVDDESENTWDTAAYGQLSTLGTAIRTNIVYSVTTAEYRPSLWTGTPKTEKEIVKFEPRPQVRKLRGRTTRFCHTA